MTKKDYVNIARIIKKHLSEADYEGESSVQGIALDLADLMAADNPLFSRETFYVACGLTSEGRL